MLRHLGHDKSCHYAIVISFSVDSVFQCCHGDLTAHCGLCVHYLVMCVYVCTSVCVCVCVCMCMCVYLCASAGVGPRKHARAELPLRQSPERAGSHTFFTEAWTSAAAVVVSDSPPLLQEESQRELAHCRRPQ